MLRSHHNAVVASSGEVWTWGSNNYGCLGREIDEKCTTFTSDPGLCSGFGTIVDQIGRGLAQSVACGKEFTVVATWPYKGPNEEGVQRLLEENVLREEKERIKTKEVEEKKRPELEHKKEEQKAYSQVKYLTSRRLCSLDCPCPGAFSRKMKFLILV